MNVEREIVRAIDAFYLRTDRLPERIRVASDLWRLLKDEVRTRFDPDPHPHRIVYYGARGTVRIEEYPTAPSGLMYIVDTGAHGYAVPDMIFRVEPPHPDWHPSHREIL